MPRVPAAVGFLAAGVAGYLLGRRERGEVSYLRQALTTALHQRTHSPPPAKGWDDETEYEHLAEHEREERHRLAEEIKHHPLRERAGDEAAESGEPPGRPEVERIDRLGPRSL
jgi:hypothetical protein